MYQTQVKAILLNKYYYIIKTQINAKATTVGGFKHSILTKRHVTQTKIIRETSKLNYIINQMGLTDTYRILYPGITSSQPPILSITEHLTEHKTSHRIHGEIK